MYHRVPPALGKPDPLSGLRRLTPRDRVLLSWLAEHYLLSADQITTALFTSRRTAQQRLTILHRIGALTRFAFSTAYGAPDPSYLYTLGPLGLTLHPHAYSDPDRGGLKAPRSHLERARRIVASRKLAHLVGVNQFFIDLHAHTRSHDETRLERWWSEQHATDAYGSAGIRPDGHGVWRVGATTVGFFLELDNATENLGRVVAKLRAYQRLTEFGPRYPILFWVPDTRRENNLQRALSELPAAMAVATAVHSRHPAEAIWALTSDPGRRLPLHQLPTDHGADSSLNPNYFPDHAAYLSDNKIA